ncbi:MAG: DUF4357 domain-containing protein [Bryobacterales bacterium]|nr:DUF4357 domain-containing protein [Bryobacterales bacterium]
MAALLKRWLLGTHRGAVRKRHPYSFTRDHLFKSASATSSAILSAGMHRPTNRKDAEGRALKELRASPFEMNHYKIIPILLCAASLSAQSNSPEVFAQIGYQTERTDGGTIGYGPSYSGGFVVPIGGRFVAELDVWTFGEEKTSDPDRYSRERDTVVLGNVLYRWGGQRIQFFAGSGIGGYATDSTSRVSGLPEDFFPPHSGYRQVSPGVYQLDHRGSGAVYLAPKFGFVAYFQRNLGVRVDVTAVQLHLGFRIGVAYTFR